MKIKQILKEYLNGRFFIVIVIPLITALFFTIYLTIPDINKIQQRVITLDSRGEFYNIYQNESKGILGKVLNIDLNEFGINYSICFSNNAEIVYTEDEKDYVNVSLIFDEEKYIIGFKNKKCITIDNRNHKFNFIFPNYNHTKANELMKNNPTFIGAEIISYPTDNFNKSINIFKEINLSAFLSISFWIIFFIILEIVYKVYNIPKDYRKIKNYIKNGKS